MRPQSGGADEPGEVDETRGESSVALADLFAQCRERLELTVRLRLDRRLQGRIDAADVLQDTYLEASKRYPRYSRQPDMPAFLWLRFLTLQTLAILHRKHLGTRMRDAAKEISLYQSAFPEASSAALAAHLLGQRTTPSQAAMRAETQVRLQAALDALDPNDREMIALRHFEQLSNSEAAQVQGLSESGASRRYAKALLRLKDVLVALGLDPSSKR
jgi:RNA polymerase sigma-70 factor (ECF subfamily)